MWKQRGRSATLERAEAVLSSRRGGGTSAAAHSSTTRELPMELLASHSCSSFSSVLGHMDDQLETFHAPKPKIDRAALEVGRPVSSLDSGANRFLKKTAPPGAQNNVEEAVTSSLRASQTAALSRLARFDSRFGKGVQKRSSSRVGQVVVPEEQQTLTRPDSVQPTCFVKSRPSLALSRDGPLGQSDSSEHSTQDFSSKLQLHCPASAQITSPAQPQALPSPSPSPLGPSPSPPSLSPSPAGPSSSVGSAQVDLHSLEELFPLDEGLEDISEHFQNLMDMDELESAALQLEEKDDKEAYADFPDDSEPLEDEDYPSDFESEIQTESLSEHIPDSAQLPLSEHTQNNTNSPSPVPSEVTKSPSPHRSEVTRSPSPHRSEVTRSPSPHRSEVTGSPSPLHSDSQTSGTSEASPEASVSDTPRRSVKIKPGRRSHRPVQTHSYSLLMESLRQQLALTSQFIKSSQEHHDCVLQNLGSPNYTYTTLEDTQQYIWKLRASRQESKQLMEKR